MSQKHNTWCLRSPHIMFPLHWRHNDHGGISNHQPHGCLLNRLFRRKSKKTSKLRVTGLCVWNSPGPVNSPHKGPVTRKMFPFDDVIMSLFVTRWDISGWQYAMVLMFDGAWYLRMAIRNARVVPNAPVFAVLSDPANLQHSFISRIGSL